MPTQLRLIDHLRSNPILLMSYDSFMNAITLKSVFLLFFLLISLMLLCDLDPDFFSPFLQAVRGIPPACGY